MVYTDMSWEDIFIAFWNLLYYIRSRFSAPEQPEKNQMNHSICTSVVSHHGNKGLTKSSV